MSTIQENAHFHPCMSFILAWRKQLQHMCLQNVRPLPIHIGTQISGEVLQLSNSSSQQQSPDGCAVTKIPTCITGEKPWYASIMNGMFSASSVDITAFPNQSYFSLNRCALNRTVKFLLVFMMMMMMIIIPFSTFSSPHVRDKFSSAKQSIWCKVHGQNLQQQAVQNVLLWNNTTGIYPTVTLRRRTLISRFILLTIPAQPCGRVHRSKFIRLASITHPTFETKYRNNTTNGLHTGVKGGSNFRFHGQSI